MEYWSDGVVGEQHSITPSLHHSNTPIPLDHSFFAELCDGFTIVAEGA